MKRVPAVLVMLAAGCLAQGPRILIVTDMEGVGGVVSADEQIAPGQRRFEGARRTLVGEISAAVEGLRGASEVVVWDGHDGSRTLSVEDIAPPAKLLQGTPTPADYYLSDKLYDGIVFIGQHAKAGTKNGILAHSQSFNVRRIAINGVEVGELGQVAAIAGYFDIPVIMLAGDQAACDELLELQPAALTVPVKRMAGKASALSLSHAEARRRITIAASQALQRVREFKPWKISGPVELVFEYLPQPPLHPAARTVTYRGRTVLEAFEAWLGRP